MKFKNTILTIFLFSIGLSAQTNLLNAKDPAEIGVKDDMQIRQDEDQKLEYGYVDDRDILFSKVIWEVIDLDQRVNFLICIQLIQPLLVKKEDH